MCLYLREVSFTPPLLNRFGKTSRLLCPPSSVMALRLRPDTSHGDRSNLVKDTDWDIYAFHHKPVPHVHGHPP